jgi:hypothetical protein
MQTADCSAATPRPATTPLVKKFCDDRSFQVRIRVPEHTGNLKSFSTLQLSNGITMASRNSGTKKKATLSSHSGDDDTKTAQIRSGKPTGWVDKTGASPVGNEAVSKVMGNAESSCSSDCGSEALACETTSPPSFPIKQSNAEVKAQPEGPDKSAMAASSWSRSSRVRDQIKFIEEMNKGSRTAATAPRRRFVSRSESMKVGEVRSD